MLRIVHGENIARVFHDEVLKAAAGAEERHIPPPRIRDGEQRAFHVSVRAAGSDQQRIRTLDSWRFDRRDLDGRHPVNVDVATEPRGGVLQR
jgi:hypothetical protein